MIERRKLLLGLEIIDKHVSTPFISVLVFVVTSYLTLTVTQRHSDDYFKLVNNTTSPNHKRTLLFLADFVFLFFYAPLSLSGLLTGAVFRHDGIRDAIRWGVVIGIACTSSVALMFSFYVNPLFERWFGTQLTKWIQLGIVVVFVVPFTIAGACLRVFLWQRKLRRSVVIECPASQ